jgi:glutathione S-transferase
MTPAITLYHAPPSTCSQKVRLVLAEKQLAYRSQLIDLFSGGQHASDYVKLNPNHVVPTLIHDGQVIIESMLICEYLEDAFPRWPLMPADPVVRHAIRLWTQYVDRVHVHAGVLSFAVGARRLIVAQGPDAIDANVANVYGEKAKAARRSVLELGVASPLFAESLAAFVAMLDRMAAALDSHRWLAGAEFSLADTAALPYLLRLDHLAMTPLIDARPGVADWYARVAARPSYGPAVTEYLAPPMVAMLRANGNDAWPEIAALLDAG